LRSLRFDFDKARKAVVDNKWKLSALALGLAVASPTLLLGVSSAVVITCAFGFMKGISLEEERRAPTANLMAATAAP